MATVPINAFQILTHLLFNTQNIGEADQLEKDLSSEKRWKCPESGKNILYGMWYFKT